MEEAKENETSTRFVRNNSRNMSVASTGSTIELRPSVRNIEDQSLKTSLINSDEFYASGFSSPKKSPDRWYLDACGLFSRQKTRRFHGQVCWCSCCGFWGVFLLIFFLVILPIIIQDMVKNSDITVVNANIYNPTNAGFQSSFTFTTGQKIPIKTTLDLGTMTTTWDGSIGLGGGSCLSISSSGPISLVNGDNVLQGTASVINNTALADMITYSVNSDSLNLQTSGTAKVTAIVETEVSLAKTMTMNGFGGFSVPPTVTSVNVTYGTPTVLTVHVALIFTSKATISMHFGQNLYFDMFYEGVYVGVGFLPNCTITSGVSRMNAIVSLIQDSPESIAAINALESNFTSGYPNAVALANFYTATPISWLAPALNTFHMTAQLTPNTVYIIKNITIFVEPGLLLAVVPYQLVLYNPLYLNLTLNTLLTNLTFKGVTVAVANDYGCNITVPPHKSVVSQYLQAKILYQNLPSLLNDTDQTIMGATCVQVLGTLDKFPIDMKYCQATVPIAIKPCSVAIPGCPGYSRSRLLF